MDGSMQTDSSGTTKMNLLSQLFKLEEKMMEEVNKIRRQIENKFQDSSEENGVRNSHNKEVNGSKGSGCWQHRGFSDIALSADQWKPLAVRNMPNLSSSPLAQQPLPLENIKGFSLKSLINTLGGEEWSPGVFYPATAAKSHSNQLKKMMKSKTYYCMDAEVEPFLPKVPGQNGAKLTVFFRENDTGTDNMHNDVPLFVGLPNNVSAAGEKLYTYFGHYSQKRWSDKLDYDRVQEAVPLHVKQHWAEKLTGSHRPGWLEQAVMEHFWPMPKYEGEIAGLDIEGTSTVTPKETDGLVEDAKEDLKDFLCELADWKKESKMKFGLLKKEHIMDAFAREDAAEEPGLRFWWEYLQCVGFDRNFYYLLANANCNGNLETSETNGLSEALHIQDLRID